MDFVLKTSSSSPYPALTLKCKPTAFHTPIPQPQSTDTLKRRQTYVFIKKKNEKKIHFQKLVQIICKSLYDHRNKLQTVFLVGSDTNHYHSSICFLVFDLHNANYYKHIAHMSNFQRRRNVYHIFLSFLPK